MNTYIEKSKNAKFIDFEIIEETTNQFIEKVNNKVSYDQIQNKIVLYWAKNFKPIYEDIEVAAANLINLNKFSINIDYEMLCKRINDQALFFIDRVLYLTYNSYYLKTITNPIKNIDYRIFSNDESHLEQLRYLNDKSLVRGYITELQDMPPNILNAERFAQLIGERLGRHENLKITVLNKEQIKEKKMNLVLAVNAASINEPRIIAIEYTGNKDDKNVYGIVGKGITMDTGGYSLKNWKSQQMMKFDMSGGAVACMLMDLIARYKPKFNICAVACVTDNLIGGAGTVTDSIIKSMNGLTVEIENTDCEGRLVLADGVTYALRECKANHIITIATLTGNAMAALNIQFSAGFTTNQPFYDKLSKAANAAFERLWQMPLTRINTENQQHSRLADIWNEAPSSKGGSSNGAGFVQQFIEDKPFIHLDICGTAGIEQRHGTGVMCSTLADLFIKGYLA